MFELTLQIFKVRESPQVVPPNLKPELFFYCFNSYSLSPYLPLIVTNELIEEVNNQNQNVHKICRNVNQGQVQYEHAEHENMVKKHVECVFTVITELVLLDLHGSDVIQIFPFFF